jgi:hypothetical protein
MSSKFFASSASRWAIWSRNASFSALNTASLRAPVGVAGEATDRPHRTFYQPSRAQWGTFTLSARNRPGMLTRFGRPVSAPVVVSKTHFASVSRSLAPPSVFSLKSMYRVRLASLGGPLSLCCIR